MSTKQKPVYAKNRPRPNRRRSYRHNPGVTGIVMNGLWVGVGMVAAGFVNGIIGPFIGGLTGAIPFGGILQGLATAYIVSWLGNRTIGHGELMGAGAFASTAVGTIGSLVGGAGSLLTGVTNAIGGGSKPQIVGGAPSPQIGPAQTNPGNVIDMTAAAGGR